MNNNIFFKNATVLSKHGSILERQSLYVSNGKIKWIGSNEYFELKQTDSYVKTIDCQFKLLTPGLIDCHTHSVYGGNRADEFRLRQQGVSYAQIAKQGGGIQSTVAKTRQLSLHELIEQSYPRVKAMVAQGVTTVEIKSGYGLDFETEVKMLKAAQFIGRQLGITIQKTFLGAHALPPEYKGRSDEYIELVCEQMLPKLAELNLVDAVDVFCESIAFNLQQSEKVFVKAKQLGLPIKCHAEQLSASGAAKLASKYQALSCEHLEYLDEGGVKAMADNHVVAVLLPGAYYFLKESQKPPIEWFRHHDIAMAIATDCNPGSSPTTSLILMMNMACTLFGMTVEEAWQAVTINAAKALGIDEQVGSIEVDKQADLVLWDSHCPADFCYYFGAPFTHRVFINGVEQ